MPQAEVAQSRAQANRKRWAATDKEKDGNWSFAQALGKIEYFVIVRVRRFRLSGFPAHVSIFPAPRKRNDSSDTCVVSVPLSHGPALVLPRVALVAKRRTFVVRYDNIEAASLDLRQDQRWTGMAARCGSGPLAVGQGNTDKMSRDEYDTEGMSDVEWHGSGQSSEGRKVCTSLITTQRRKRPPWWQKGTRSWQACKQAFCWR